MNAGESPIPESLRALLGLFETEFKDVKFPDVDVEVLADAGRKVLSAAERVAQAEAALEAAELALQEQQDALLAKGQRALAYARVFAEESPELSEKLQAISLPRAQRRAKAGEPPAASAEVAPVRRRGRPPKIKPEAPNLFADAVASVELAAS